MPYPTQTDRERIIQMARTLIEAEGVDRLSLARLASDLNIKAPSLYHHVKSKDELLHGVVLLTYQELFKAYDLAFQDPIEAPHARLLAILRAHRAFAHRWPQTYTLAFTTTVPEQRADARLLEQMALPLQELMAEVAGHEQSLPALRGALALAHGFVLLELNDQLRRGGDLTAAFEAAIAAYLAGWAKLANTESS